jgi:hypothetical protein
MHSVSSYSILLELSAVVFRRSGRFVPGWGHCTDNVCREFLQIRLSESISLPCRGQQTVTWHGPKLISCSSCKIPWSLPLEHIFISDQLHIARWHCQLHAFQSYGRATNSNPHTFYLFGIFLRITAVSKSLELPLHDMF